MASSIFRARAMAATFVCIWMSLAATTSTVVAAAPSSKTNNDESLIDNSEQRARKSSASSRTSERTGRAIEECCAAGDGDEGGAAATNTTVEDNGDKFVYLDERRCNVTCVSALVSDAYVNRTLFVGGAYTFSLTSYYIQG
jgi:hypothetical protein